jgi:hypothetical protein
MIYFSHVYSFNPMPS